VVLCIFDKHVSNGNELTVMSENMRKVISVYTTTNRYYRILESITVLNMITPGSDIVSVFSCVYFSNGKNADCDVRDMVLC
jgi:hypothetical protein